MAKYYIVPFETNEEKMICDFQPKYLAELTGKIRGVQPIITNKIGSKAVAWREEYYIIVTSSILNQKLLEACMDVIRVDKDTLKEDLENLDIPNDDIPVELTPDRRDKVDKSVTKWLINEERILRNL